MPGAALDEQRDHRLVDRPAERRPADDVAFVKVADAVHVGAGVEQRAHDVDVAVRCRPVQRGGVVSGFARVRIGAVFQQQADGVHVSAFGGLVQFSPSSIARHTCRIAGSLRDTTSLSADPALKEARYG